MGLAVLFPGQGVQMPGMGCEWRRDPAWSVVDRAEAALGTPLAPLLLDESAEVLNRTRSAQLGVFLASLLAWEATKERVGEPTAFAGHSLGQVTALVAAGVITLEDGVRLVDARGRSTQQAALARPGRMVALLGGSADQVMQASKEGDRGQARQLIEERYLDLLAVVTESDLAGGLRRWSPHADRLSLSVPWFGMKDDEQLAAAHQLVDALEALPDA